MTDLRYEDDSVQSVHHEAIREAEKHKWIESQKHGRDVGEAALREWCDQHWPKFCRDKYMQHLTGLTCWKEFSRNKFGLLNDNPVSDGEVLERVKRYLIGGGENLCIINNELDATPKFPSTLYQLLNLINLNDDRIDPPFR